MKKAYNFNAGPCVLPKPAIEAAIEALKDFKGTGMSVIEVSHRSKEWEAVMDECRSLWKELLNIPEGYSVLFLGGGASLQFLYVAMNLLENKAGYLETGVWAKKALKEAKGIGNAPREQGRLPGDRRMGKEGSERGQGHRQRLCSGFLSRQELHLHPQGL